jgi:lipid-binding SYLF domain-containing protein
MAATQVVQAMVEDPEGSIPVELLREARALVILREYSCAFIFGATVGKGIVLVHNKAKGEWSAPGFIESYEGSCGLQLGGTSKDTLLLIMDDRALQQLSETKFRLGGNLTVVQGPLQSEMHGWSNPEASVIAYSQAQGVFAGMNVGGGYLERDAKANAQYYGRALSLDEILFTDSVALPAQMADLVQLLNGVMTADEQLLPPDEIAR